ncbi:glycosyltransferase [uncultured Ilyobacter sp.]|uniref:glycosyltransferase n=1 Tax=uncultured Ilyobacter sp. TaxID=544433 RepID=UPI0029C88F17|nr:glycosyltransferase [uncultured Ilyobacter sp.]
MKKKKLMFLITGLYYGGMERVALIAHSLLKDEYDISLVTLYSGDKDYKLDFDYYDLKCTPKHSQFSKVINTFNRIKKVKKIKNEINPDIVMSFGAPANFSNAVTKSNEKVILGIRSYDWLYNYFATHQIDKWTYNKADTVVSVSKVISKGANLIFCLNEEKSKTLYNPYDLNYIEKKSYEIVEEGVFPDDCFNIISVGRLVNQKGYNHLVKAFSIVAKQFLNCNLYIIGGGEKESELIKLISDLGLQDRIFLLGKKENPYKYMRKADIFVLSSITEGFPNAMVEAMAVGLPILAVDCKSGPREILSESSIDKKASEIELCEYGVIVPEVSKSLDYKSELIEECDYNISNGIIEFIKNPEMRKKYSRCSLQRAGEFTYNRFKENLMTIIENNENKI